MQKYSARIFFSFVLFFCCVELLGMEQADVFLKLPVELVKHMMPYCGIQSIGRLGIVAKNYNHWYQNVIFCKPLEKVCLSVGCAFFAKDSKHAVDACTQWLAFYAKKYQKEKDENDKQRFKHLWQYHKDRRLLAVKNIRSIDFPTIKDCLDTYAGNCENIPRIRKDNTARLKELLEKSSNAENYDKIEILLQNRYGFDDEQSLLLPAVTFGDNNILQKIIDLNCKDNKNECWDLDSVMKHAVFLRRSALITFLIKKYENYCKKHRFDLFELALNHRYCVEEMLLLFADDINVVDKKGNSLLHYAAAHVNEKAMRFLLNKDININIENNKNETALAYFFSGSSDLISLYLFYIMKIFIEYGININKTDDFGRTLLMLIAPNSDSNELSQIVSLLIDSGADIHATDHSGRTALHYYAEKRHYDASKKLIDAGINIHSVDNEGKTAFHQACIYGNIPYGSIDTLEMLLDAGSDINACDNNGDTAFLFCAKPFGASAAYGTKWIGFLLENGAKGSIVNKKQQGFFHCLAKKNYSWGILPAYKYDELYEHVYKQVVEAGARIDAVDIDGNTPLMIAENNGDGYMIELLKKLEAKVKTSSVTNDSKKTTWYDEFVRYFLLTIQLGAVVMFACFFGVIIDALILKFA